MSNKKTIYVITNEKTGRHYVGKTERPLFIRLAEHMRGCKHGRTKNKEMQEDFDKYGESSFSIKEVLTCTENESSLLEYAVMDAFKARDKRFGYNVRDTKNQKNAIHEVEPELIARITGGI